MAAILIVTHPLILLSYEISPSPAGSPSGQLLSPRMAPPELSGMRAAGKLTAIPASGPWPRRTDATRRLCPARHPTGVQMPRGQPGFRHVRGHTAAIIPTRPELPRLDIQARGRLGDEHLLRRRTRPA